VQQTMGGFFPELTDEKIADVMEILNEEEASFRVTLTRGRKLFERKAAAAVDGKFDGTVAFELKDTYGFPIDLTMVMAEERGLTIDMEKYEEEIEKARLRSMGQVDESKPLVWKEDAATNAQLLGELEAMKPPATDDSAKYEYSKGEDGKYTYAQATGDVVAIRIVGGWADEITEGTEAGIVLSKTCFYGEQGGQQYDAGFLTLPDGSEFTVKDVRVKGSYVVHIGVLQGGTVKKGDAMTGEIDGERRGMIMSNHTATHILNFGLRKVLGQCDQEGSLVEPDKMRFDFSAKKALTTEQVRSVEAETRKVIGAQLPVLDKEVPLDDAMQIKGLRAMFGEKYPDPVRLLVVGAEPDTLVSNPESGAAVDVSAEFCGGTHVRNSGDIGDFVFVKEEAIAKGKRRAICLSGKAATKAIAFAEEVASKVSDDLDKPGISSIKDMLNDPANPSPAAARADILTRLGTIEKKLVTAEKAKMAKLALVTGERAKAIVEEKPKLVVENAGVGPYAKPLSGGIQTIKKQSPETVVVWFGADATGVQVNALVPKAVGKATGLDAKAMVEQIAPIIGGKAGGSAEIAMCSGSNVDKVEEAIEVAKAFASKALGL